MVMIEVIANDRLGKKVRVKVDSDDTVETLKVPPLVPPPEPPSTSPVFRGSSVDGLDADGCRK
jgi:hypothetical protein